MLPVGRGVIAAPLAAKAGAGPLTPIGETVELSRYYPSLTGNLDEVSGPREKRPGPTMMWWLRAAIGQHESRLRGQGEL